MQPPFEIKREQNDFSYPYDMPTVAPISMEHSHMANKQEQATSLTPLGQCPSGYMSSMCPPTGQHHQNHMMAPPGGQAEHGSMMSTPQAGMMAGSVLHGQHNMILPSEIKKEPNLSMDQPNRQCGGLSGVSQQLQHPSHIQNPSRCQNPNSTMSSHQTGNTPTSNAVSSQLNNMSSNTVHSNMQPSTLHSHNPNTPSPHHHNVHASPHSMQSASPNQQNMHFLFSPNAQSSMQPNAAYQGRMMNTMHGSNAQRPGGMVSYPSEVPSVSMAQSHHVQTQQYSGTMMTQQMPQQQGTTPPALQSGNSSSNSSGCNGSGGMNGAIDSANTNCASGGSNSSNGTNTTVTSNSNGCMSGVGSVAAAGGCNKKRKKSETTKENGEPIIKQPCVNGSDSGGIRQETMTDKLPVRKKRDRFNGMTEEEVLKRTLPDHFAHNLDIIIVGINPGLTAAYIGHHYAGPGNHFWKCLYLSGLIPEPLTAYDDHKLLQYGIGFTNIVNRTSRGSSDLTRKEIKEGGEVLKEKIMKWKPKIAVFNGKGIYEVFCGHKNFHIGKQPEPFPGTNTTCYVMPSSSARCSQLPRAIDKVPFYVALKKLRDHARGDITHLDDAEVCFPDLELKVKVKEDKGVDDIDKKRLKQEIKQQGMMVMHTQSGGGGLMPPGAMMAAMSDNTNGHVNAFNPQMSSMMPPGPGQMFPGQMGISAMMKQEGGSNANRTCMTDHRGPAGPGGPAAGAWPGMMPSVSNMPTYCSPGAIKTEASSASGYGVMPTTGQYSSSTASVTTADSTTSNAQPSFTNQWSQQSSVYGNNSAIMASPANQQFCAPPNSMGGGGPMSMQGGSMGWRGPASAAGQDYMGHFAMSPTMGTPTYSGQPTHAGAPNMPMPGTSGPQNSQGSFVKQEPGTEATTNAGIGSCMMQQH